MMKQPPIALEHFVSNHEQACGEAGPYQYNGGTAPRREETLLSALTVVQYPID